MFNEVLYCTFDLSVCCPQEPLTLASLTPWLLAEMPSVLLMTL